MISPVLMKRFFFTAIISLALVPARAQQSLLKDSTVSLFMVHAHYAVQFPFGELADRFGVSHALGAGMGFKTKKNVFINLDGSFLFSNKVKETDILRNITDAYGSLIGASGLLTNYSFSEKGFSLQLQGGKIIPFKKPNVNSGLMALLGAGYLQHKISIDVDENEVPMLNKEYKKGYDRLTGGFMLSQFIGYFYIDAKRKRINCYGGIEITEAFTKNLRSWNFDENRKDDKARKDIFMGVKLGWVIPFYRTQTEKFYYY